jgi:hypothetical protein
MPQWLIHGPGSHISHRAFECTELEDTIGSTPTPNGIQGAEAHF